MILPVSQDDLPKAWAKVEPMIQKGLDRVDLQDRYTTHYLLRAISNQEKMLWVATDGTSIQAALVTGVVEYPTGLREMEIFIAGGEDLDKWLKQAIETLSSFAKKHGCIALSGAGRKGWIRAVTGLVPQYRFRLEI